MAKAIKFNNQEHVLYFDVQRRNGSRPFMLNMAQRDAPQIELKLREKITRWDFLSTFKPPENLSIESGQIYRTERLAENSPDYEHVSKAFLSTFGGYVHPPAPANPGVLRRVGKKPIAIKPPPGMFGGGVFGGPAMPGGGRINGAPVIKRIEKVYNCVIYEKFINEFKRMLKKYPMKNVNDIMKHLFHGTRATDP